MSLTQLKLLPLLYPLLLPLLFLAVVYARSELTLIILLCVYPLLPLFLLVQKQKWYELLYAILLLPTLFVLGLLFNLTYNAVVVGPMNHSSLNGLTSGHSQSLLRESYFDTLTSFHSFVIVTVVLIAISALLLFSISQQLINKFPFLNKPLFYNSVIGLVLLYWILINLLATSIGQSEPLVPASIQIAEDKTNSTPIQEESNTPQSPKPTSSVENIEREQLSVYIYRQGDAIYSTSENPNRPTLILRGVDAATFAPEPTLTTQRLYTPVIDGGFMPHWYQDKVHFYCGVGRKGGSEVVRLTRPVTIITEELSEPFDMNANGFSEEEQQAWQNRETGEYLHLYLLGVSSDTLYDPQTCQKVAST